MGGTRRDRVRAEARRLLAAGVSGQAFPGATSCAAFRDKDGAVEYARACAGNLSLGGKPVREDTFYDLASLTKPLVATIALRLVARKALTFETRADQLLSEHCL